MAALKDILRMRPRILFVGINPGLRSAELGHHFAGKGNPFWRLLYDARLVPDPITYRDDKKLPHYGIALTNLCARPTRSSTELRPDELKRGSKLLLRKIARLQPRVVALVGLSIYRELFGKVGSKGAGLKPQKLFGASVFVLPNPSGRNANFPSYADKLKWFVRLRELVESECVASHDVTEFQTKKSVATDGRPLCAMHKKLVKLRSCANRERGKRPLQVETRE